MFLFAVDVDTTKYGGWIAAGILALGAVVKAIIDISRMRFSQSQTTSKLAFSRLERVISHIEKELKKKDEQLARQDLRLSNQEDEIAEIRKLHNECEKRAAWRESELIRNGIELRPYPETGSGPHPILPPSQEEEYP